MERLEKHEIKAIVKEVSLRIEETNNSIEITEEQIDEEMKKYSKEIKEYKDLDDAINQINLQKQTIKDHLKDSHKLKLNNFNDVSRWFLPTYTDTFSESNKDYNDFEISLRGSIKNKLKEDAGYINYDEYSDKSKLKQRITMTSCGKDLNVVVEKLIKDLKGGLIK